MTTKGSKRFREIIRILERRFGFLEEGELSCCGITLAQCHALVEIGRAASISLIELAQTLCLDNSTMSRTVNNLVESGLAVRDLDPQDRRFVSIALTEKGQNLFRQIEAGMDEYYEEIYEHLPEDKKAQVLESLELIVDAVNKSACCGGNDC